MDELYTWKVTLADGKVIEEAKGAKFDLAWEEPGSIKKIELIGEKHFECNLENGEFCVDDEKYFPDADLEGPKKLYFRKRRQIRSDGFKQLEKRTKYLYGYEVNGNLHIASVQPKQGMKEEEINFPQSVSNPDSYDKPIDYKPDDFKAYYQNLVDIDGIGHKTAKDIMTIFPTEEELRDSIIEGQVLPIRNDLADKLKERFK